jgi:hypothetical protein
LKNCNFADQIIIDMAVTRLKRKDRRNKAVANNKVAAIKILKQRPIIKLVDVEEIKASFAK